MQINMQIVLTQDDIANAVRSYLRAEIPLQEDQDIQINFSVDNISCVAVTDKGEATVTETKPTRTRRTKAQIEADLKAEQAAKEAAEKETETPDISAPFDTSSDDSVLTDESAAGNDAPINAPAPNIFGGSAELDRDISTTSSAIFPNQGSSAPVMPEMNTPPPANPKSLFGNLTGPTVSH